MEHIYVRVCVCESVDEGDMGKINIAILIRTLSRYQNLPLTKS